MKKCLIAVLSAVLLFSFSACSDKSEVTIPDETVNDVTVIETNVSGMTAYDYFEEEKTEVFVDWLKGLTLTEASEKGTEYNGGSSYRIIFTTVSGENYSYYLADPEYFCFNGRSMSIPKTQSEEFYNLLENTAPDMFSAPALTLTMLVDIDNCNGIEFAVGDNNYAATEQKTEEIIYFLHNIQFEESDKLNLDENIIVNFKSSDGDTEIVVCENYVRCNYIWYEANVNVEEQLNEYIK